MLAVNPHTNAVINVAPIFEALEQFGESGSMSTNQLCEGLDKAIQLIALTVHDQDRISPEEVVNINFDLYRIKEMLVRMLVLPVADPVE